MSQGRALRYAASRLLRVREFFWVAPGRWIPTHKEVAAVLSDPPVGAASSP